MTRAWRYLGAIGAVLLAAALTAAVPLLRERLTYFLFWPTMFAVSWYAGLGPGVAATILSIIAVILLQRSGQDARAFGLESWLTMVVFLLAGVMGALMARWRAGAVTEAERALKVAETANRAKDTFLANISHELRTPLSPILAWTRMLREGRLTAEQTRRAIEVIERNAQMQAKLVEDILDVSRITEGKLKLQVRPTVLSEVIEAAIETVRPAAEARDVRLQVVLDTSLAPIPGDPDRLQQVAWNLLSNAIKFTPKGGRVHVVLERVNSHVEIAVADTGRGIPPDQLPHLFERFWQADSPPTQGRTGLGLGLAIVRHLVELHGGSVTAESPGEGQGSTFTVKLPVIPVARSAGEFFRRHPIQHTAEVVPQLASARLDGLRVLVVDDEPDSNEVVRVLLDQCGAEVRTAGSSTHALEKLNHWTPDVVVTDIGMPGDDGYALLSSIRSQPGPLGRVPVVALTAYAGVDDRVRMVSAGFQMHVGKPADPRELTAAIASLARNRHPA